jgi:hypothetical protein
MIDAPAWSDDADAGYFQAVEEHVVRLRGAPLILSPDDWHLAAAWQERRIPLGTVLRAISQVFATAAARGRRAPIQSLAYCRHAVEEEFARHLAAAVGDDNMTTPHPQPAARLRVQASRLAAALAQWPAAAQSTARQVLTEVEKLAAALSADTALEAAESRLASLEDALLTSIEAALPDTDRAGLRRQCETRLAEHRSRMSPAIYERTCQRALRGEIRRQWQVPRLSLLAD